MKATYTQWSLFDTCPAWFKAQYLDESVPRQESDALVKGRRVHEALEAFLKGDGELPPEVHESWHESLKEVRSTGGFDTEIRIDNDIAYGKIDLLLTERIVDFKTGKPRPNDLKVRDQLMFYAWLYQKPVQAELWWVEHPRKLHRTLVSLPLAPTPTQDRVWRERITRMQTGPYAPTPNWKCRWCPLIECPHHPDGEGGL